ncbi:hypothetical protein Adt_13508 [Abeliophyllum distichum]|uniref:Uncharacterized protein n=1 Tax=Abeliophyllum distichum TaxID=126358 RepID=A0ABD1TX03_9LAMI
MAEVEDSGAPEGEAPLKRKRNGGASSPPRVDPVFGGLGVGPFDSKKKLRELIRPLGSRISDDTLKNIPFFPSMGAQAVKKYFTPKWEEFASHGNLEDVLKVGLAAAIRATSLQMKVLMEFRTCMHEHKKLVADASKSDKEHQQALEEALEAVNKEKRCLQSESESRELEAQRLREDLEVFKKVRKEAESELARLLGEKKEMEAKLESVEADFIANFHNIEAYTNFSNYFARVGHQKLLAMLRVEHPDLDLRPLQARFPPPEAEGEEGS